jgi:hypothetical protein
VIKSLSAGMSPDCMYLQKKPPSRLLNRGGVVNGRGFKDVYL